MGRHCYVESLLDWVYGRHRVHSVVKLTPSAAPSTVSLPLTEGAAEGALKQSPISVCSCPTFDPSPDRPDSRQRAIMGAMKSATEEEE